MPAGQNALSEAAAEAGFRIEAAVIEAVGLCPACRDAGPPKAAA